MSAFDPKRTFAASSPWQNYSRCCSLPRRETYIILDDRAWLRCEHQVVA